MPALKKQKTEHNFGSMRAKLGLDKEFFVNDQRGFISAWSSQNVLAVASLPPPDLFDERPAQVNACTIKMTYFSPGGTGDKQRKMSWTLSLPNHGSSSSSAAAAPAAAEIVGLDFSADGRFLLVTSGTIDNDCLTLFEQGECLNEWSVLWSEEAKNVGLRQAKTVVKTKWLDSALTPEWVPDENGSLSPKPARHAATRGNAFVSVLSTCEILVAFLPPARPLFPLIAVLPLYSPRADGTALPTVSLIDGTQTAVDSLVSSLVTGAAPATSSTANGAQAMRDQLQAAKTDSEEETRLLQVADVGFPRVTDPLKGEIELIVASSFLPPRYEWRKQEESAAAKQRPKSSAGEEEKPFDFADIDAAFPSAAPSPADPSAVKDEEDDKSSAAAAAAADVLLEPIVAHVAKVAMTHVSINILAPEGPRIKVEAMPSLFAVDAQSGVHPWAEVTGLVFSASSLIDTPKDDEGTQDLSIAAIMSFEEQSWINKYEVLYEPYRLTPAFKNVAKPGASLVAPPQWTYTRMSHLAIARTAGASGYAVAAEAFGYRGLVVLEHTSDGSSRVRFLDRTLGETASVPLPRGIYSQLSLSPNLALLCATRAYQEPVIVATTAVEFGEAIAISVLAERDISDVTGLIASPGQANTTASRATQLVKEALKPVALADSTTRLDLLGDLAQVFSRQPETAHKSKLALDVLQVAVALKTFATCRIRERGQSATTNALLYRCEADSVWPLIGHAGWYIDFVKDLVRFCLDDIDKPNTAVQERWLILTDAKARADLLTLAKYVTGLQAYLEGLQASQAAAKGAAATIAPSATIELAHDVLTDITMRTISMPAWQATLSLLSTKLVGGDAPPLYEFSIDTARIDDAKTAAKEELKNVLVSAADEPSTASGTNATTLDVMRKSILPPRGSFKKCSRCGHTVARQTTLGGAQGLLTPLISFGKWSAVEMSWKNACHCGGLWLAFAL